VGAAAAAHSTPLRRTRAGVLTVACSDAAWAHELRMRGHELLPRLAEACPGAEVAGLRFVVADHVAREETPAAAPPPVPPAPTEAQRAAARAAAADLGDERLRDLIARAAAASAAAQTGRSVD
jgi:hypothetical protein